MTVSLPTVRRESVRITGGMKRDHVSTPGLRVAMLGQHSRPYMLPFQDFKGRVADETYAASEDPAYLRSLMRDDEDQLRVDPFAVPRAQ